MRTVRRRPLIGITTYGPDGSPAAFSLPSDYVQAVTRAGGDVILLAPGALSARRALEQINGLILSGGGDLDPDCYGGKAHETIYMVNPERDRFELELARQALELPQLPLLGICRGLQVLNVVSGGSLDPHIPDRYGTTVTHRRPPREPVDHPVCLEGESIFRGIFGCDEFPVCSWHHQSISRVGRGLKAVAFARDDVIEGLVHEEHPFWLGVQWHPELQVSEDPLQLRLFQALVERAGEASCA